MSAETSSPTRTIVIAVVAVGLVAGLIVLLAFGLRTKSEPDFAPGTPAPDKELTRLGADGSASLADYGDRWRLVNFWASWCEPCRAEAPALESFQREHSGDVFTVLGINLDDTTDDGLAFVEEFGLTYPQLRDGDGEERREAYGMIGFPESFLVDPDGKVALIRRGPVDAEYLERYVEPLIAKAPAK